MYWTKTYGGRDAFECLVRTILSQNTSDVASQPARDALMDGYGPDDTADDPDLAVALADAEQSHLAETISSAGLYNQKSARIIDIAERVVAEYGSAAGFDFSSFARATPTRSGHPAGDERRRPQDGRLRPAVRRRPGVFPVDTHVHRIARRLGVAPADADHEGVREALEAAVPGEVRFRPHRDDPVRARVLHRAEAGVSRRARGVSHRGTCATRWGCTPWTVTSWTRAKRRKWTETVILPATHRYRTECG